jgi:hypothetical protein
LGREQDKEENRRKLEKADVSVQNAQNDKLEDMEETDFELSQNMQEEKTEGGEGVVVWGCGDDGL